MTPRRRLTPEQRRAELLECAHAVVNEHGPSGLSLELVAERAGCSRNTAYTYFPNREALVGELQDRMRTRLGERVRAELSSGMDAPSWARAWSSVVFAEAEANGGMLLLLFGPDRLDPEGTAHQRNLAIVRMVRDRLAADPTIGAERARVLARLLLGLVVAGVLAIAVDGEPRARVEAEVADVVVRLLGESAPH
jgi:AcrR family transcriptional regulator